MNSQARAAAARSRFSTACFAVAALVAAGAASAGPKEDLHAELGTLQAQIEQFKREGSASGLAQALARCAEISAQMGGDGPAAAGARAADDNRAVGGVIAPPNCVSSLATFSNSTPVPIADVAVSTSTIVVSGAGSFLWDLNVVTGLQHTFAADLDITLTSPAGTVVTLTSDNGAGNDNVFDGTLWDDDANPGGALPYGTNNGLVTDHAYTNLTTATPLVPEEALSAFAGEDPNGTWTLSISDDLSGDTGTLGSWSLQLTTFAVAPTAATANFSQAAPTPIADVAVSSSTLAVSGAGTAICGVDLTTDISHTFAADLDITLTSPAGTVVTLTTDNGAGNDNVFAGTLWDDDANPLGALPYTTNNGLATDQAYVNLTVATPLVPEESFGAFFGEDPNGTWTLSVSDDLSGDTGTLNNWSLAVTTCACAPPNADLSLTMTAAAPSPLVPGQNVTYTMNAANAGPGPASAVVVNMQLSGLTTHVSNTCGATVAGGALTWNVGNLAVGGNATCTVVARVAASGAITASATIAAAETDPVPGNNTGAVTLQGTAQSIPVNAPWALLLLGGVLLLAGFAVLRRKRAGA